jgi:ubiquinone/menaquinone biosynthesis C-methylase UbiE
MLVDLRLKLFGVKDLLERIQNETPKEFDYQWLGEFVRSIDLDKLDYREYLPEITDGENYARNILCLEPFECVLLRWPPKVESAVHLHEGFWGYVICLEGMVENHDYRIHDGVMTENLVMRAMEQGIINEPDGTIHKICNCSEENELVTLHFYFPALDTLDGLKLYNLEDGTIGTLNEKALTASFIEPDEHFHSLEREAFSFDNANSKSHRIFPIIPKPASAVISELISQYYTEQALEYDSFDLKHASRNKYTKKINDMIASGLKSRVQMRNMLDVACGTGRRTLEIKGLSERDFDITGIDLSEGMCEVARDRGINAQADRWLDADLTNQSFDAAIFLYAFGHIPTEQERRLALQKIYDHLTPGGTFFFDVFNANDKNEWGPSAIRHFEKMGLNEFGYERGDVFYQKNGGKEVAFLHYYQEEGIASMLKDIGFEIESIEHIGYVYRSGELLNGEQEGSLFIKAVKPV